MIYDSNSSVLGMVVSFWFLVPEKQEISVKWSNPLCELCPVNPNAKHESVLFFIVLIFKILCFLFFPFKKKMYITNRNLKQLESLTQMPCPQV